MNYIKLFEEFDPKYINPLMDKIGKSLPKFGHAKMCFEFGKNSIIKFFQLEYYNETELVNCVKQRKLNLNVIPKIYKIGCIKPKEDDYFDNLFGKYLDKNKKDYKLEFDNNDDLFFIIEEKIFPDKEIENQLIEINLLYNQLNENSGFAINKHNFLKELQNNIFTLLKLSNKMQKLKESLDGEDLKLFNRLVDIYHTLAINDIVISDFNFENFGKNQKGDIITFDLADVYEFSGKKRFDKKDLDYII